MLALPLWTRETTDDDVVDLLFSAAQAAEAQAYAPSPSESERSGRARVRSRLRRLTAVSEEGRRLKAWRPLLTLLREVVGSEGDGEMGELELLANQIAMLREGVRLFGSQPAGQKKGRKGGS